MTVAVYPVILLIILYVYTVCLLVGVRSNTELRISRAITLLIVATGRKLADSRICISREVAEGKIIAWIEAIQIMWILYDC